MSLHLSFVLLTAMLVTTGCETIEVLSFRKDPRSGVLGDAVTSLQLINRSTDINSPEISPKANDFPGLPDVMRSKCQAVSQPGPTAAFVAAAGAAVAGLIVESAINAASEAIQARVDALKQASKKGYSGILILDDARTLGGGAPRIIEQCLLLTRRIKKKDDEGSDPGSAFLIGVVPRGVNAARSATAVVFTPLYAYVERAAAVTRSGQPIDAAIGLSVVAIVAGKSGPERREISLGAFQVDGLELSKAKLFPGSAGTGLMALPPSTSAALELRVAVVETGSALPDFDKSKAEIQAVRDALGPAIKDAVVKAFPGE